LRETILKMDIYATPEQVMLDERALSERLGVSVPPSAKPSRCSSRTVSSKPCHAAASSVRRTKTEIVDMIRAWAALEAWRRA
jgi:hypothetical protein